MIQKLQMFVALATERHFGRAAEVCGVTQPTLSSAIKHLEHELGVMLVRRGSRFAGLTPEGERALAWARRILDDHRALREEVASVRTGLSGVLQIGVIPTAMPLVADLTDPLIRRHPGLEVTILSQTSNQILRALDSLEVDVGLTYLDNEPIGRLAQIPLFRERYCLVYDAASFDAPGDPLGWAEAAEYPLCLLTPGNQNRRIIDQQFAAAGVAPRVGVQSNSIIALLGHVLAGGRATVLPIKMARLFAGRDRIRWAVLGGGAPAYEVGLVTLAQETHRPAVEALMREARRSTARSIDAPNAPTDHPH